MDLVLRLRELRRMSGLSQEEVALRSGVGVKTLSSFETGERIGSMKVSQLQRVLGAYGTTESEFFGGNLEAVIGSDLPADAISGAQKLNRLPYHVRRALIERIELMIDTACITIGIESQPAKGSATLRDARFLSSAR